MAPIPRCDLRLPSASRSSRTTTAVAAVADADDSKSNVTSATEAPKRPSQTDMVSERPSLQEGGAERAPMRAHRSLTRDSAEILEGADEFSTGVTRDMAEIREHKLHEGNATEEAALDGAEGAAKPDTCTMLEQCRAEVEAGAAATAAATVSDAEDAAAPAAVDVVATPGDVCAQFCEDRAESPSSGYNLRAAIESDKFRRRKKSAKRCKGAYAPTEAYSGLWCGARMMSARHRLELEMRKKRKLYEGLHERNRRRRERERRRAKETHRMMRCRDQARIMEAVDNIVVNKAFYLRFNYNKRLPFMPSAMNEHLQKFKKPPFKYFSKGSSRPCRKEVDEFEKLRVIEVKSLLAA